MEHTAAHRPSMAIGGSAALFAACCMSAYVLIGENSTELIGMRKESPKVDMEKRET